MRTVKEWGRSKINKITSYEAETLTEKLRRITEEKTPIDEAAEIIYTNKADGVLPGYDIRTDRFEIARESIEKMGKAEATKIAKTENVPNTDIGQEPS